MRALRAAKFTCAELANEAGYSVKELVGSGFTPDEMRAVGFTAKQLRSAGLKIEDLKKKVDPVFVPLLDALVHHQPEDVESFIVERLQASIRRRGGEGGGGGDDLVAAASGV